MALVKSRAITLRTYKLGETSKVVVCYTRDFGKVRLVAKGARRGGGRLGAALEPMVVSGVVFYLRQGRDLSLVSQAEVERQWPALRRDVVRMAYAGAVLELTDALVSEQERDPGLFDLLESTLDRVAAVALPSLDLALWGYEVALSTALGYGPSLARCVVCDSPVEGGASFSPGLGGSVCKRCVGKAPGARALSDAAAAVMSRLQQHDEGSGQGTATSVRDEVSDALLSFLGEHAGRQLKLRSLEFLAQVRRTGQYNVESEQDNDG